VEDYLMMTDPDRGTDRAGRRAKRFLTPLQKYEIFLQLVRQEVTLAEAADRQQPLGHLVRQRPTVKQSSVSLKVPLRGPAHQGLALQDARELLDAESGLAQDR
jgi:hypothetical protein